MLDRLRRFGIPLLVYTFFISPFVSWMALGAAPGAHVPFVAYWVSRMGPQTMDTGVMWFVWALLLMDGVFVLWVRYVPHADLFGRVAAGFPSMRRLCAFALAVGAASFLVRMVIPVGASVLWGLQLAYFPGYIAAFVAGIAAWRGCWLDDIPDGVFRSARTAVIAATVSFPAVLLLLIVSTPKPGPVVAGGFHWQAALYAMWEPWLLVGMSVCLLRWGQQRLNAPSSLHDWATGSYVAYMLQPIFIVGLAILLRTAALPPIAKFPIVAAGAIALAYAVARGLREFAPVRALVG